MMRSRFDQQLEQLFHELREMGASCKEAIQQAAEAIQTQDKNKAAQVSALEQRIDNQEHSIIKTLQ